MNVFHIAEPQPVPSMITRLPETWPRQWADRRPAVGLPRSRQMTHAVKVVSGLRNNRVAIHPRIRNQQTVLPTGRQHAPHTANWFCFDNDLGSRHWPRSWIRSENKFCLWSEFKIQRQWNLQLFREPGIWRRRRFWWWRWKCRWWIIWWWRFGRKFWRFCWQLLIRTSIIRRCRRGFRWWKW